MNPHILYDLPLTTMSIVCMHVIAPMSWHHKVSPCSCFCVCFFIVRLLSVLRGHSFFSPPPQRPMTSDVEGFQYQILSITLLSYL